MSPLNHLSEPAIEFRLLNQISLDRWYVLQERLIRAAILRDAPQIDVVFCEHPRSITVGASGSRAHVRMTGEQLRRRQLDLRWVHRGGGCVLHAPGQLAIYPVVPLHAFGWSAAEFRRRFRSALAVTLSDLRIAVQRRSLRSTICGRTGPLAVLGVAVRHGMTSHGAYLNVNPSMSDFGFVDVIAPRDGDKSVMSSLVAERRRPVKMSEVRSAIIKNLADVFECPRYHIHTGHPHPERGKSIA